MIRSLLIAFALLLLQASAFGQMKKSYQGKYAGQIPGYEINTGMEKIRVAKTDIEIRILPSELFIVIGGQEMKGTWTLLFEARAYYVLTGNMENQSVEERIIVYKKGKKISREGIRPQPDAMLEKKK